MVLTRAVVQGRLADGELLCLCVLSFFELLPLLATSNISKGVSFGLVVKTPMSHVRVPDSSFLINTDRERHQMVVQVLGLPSPMWKTGIESPALSFSINSAQTIMGV